MKVPGIFVAVIFTMGVSCESANNKSMDVAFKPVNVTKDSIVNFTAEFFNGEIKVTVPESWNIIEDDNYYAIRKKCTKEKFCSNMVLNLVSNEENTDLILFAEAIINEIETKFEQSKIIDVKHDTVDGKKSVIVDYKMMAENTHLGGTTVFIENKNRKSVLIFRCMGLNEPVGEYVKFRKIFWETITSLTWI